MSSSFIDQMNDIRVRQGREPIDSAHIEGFGPGQPAAPPMPDSLPEPSVPSAVDLFGDPVETAPEAKLEPLASPLVELARGRPRVVDEVRVPTVKEELWVSDLTASYRGRQASLTEPEKKAISKVVLKAIKRDLDSQYQELTGGKPRASSGASPAPPVSPKRKPGRPRSQPKPAAGS